MLSICINVRLVPIADIQDTPLGQFRHPNIAMNDGKLVCVRIRMAAEIAHPLAHIDRESASLHEK